MSDTPRTDAVSELAGVLRSGTVVVRVAHVREIERELAAAKRDVREATTIALAFSGWAFPEPYDSYVRETEAKLRALAALHTDDAKRDGYVLVPKEPTEAMLLAAVSRPDPPDDEWPSLYRDVYKAMLAALSDAKDAQK